MGEGGGSAFGSVCCYHICGRANVLRATLQSTSFPLFFGSGFRRRGLYNASMSGRPRIQAHFTSGGTAAFKEEDLIRRFDQFYAESETIVAGVAASIAANDLAKLGELVDLSQKLTDTHLRNQVKTIKNICGHATWCLVLGACNPVACLLQHALHVPRNKSPAVCLAGRVDRGNLVAWLTC